MSLRVVAGLIHRHGKLLACQRKKQGAFPLKWEFPGGKIEPGEDELAALRRELKEELEIEVREAREIFRHRHLYRDWNEVELIFFEVSRFDGTIENRVFETLLWAGREDLATLDFLEGDRPLIEKLVSGDLELTINTFFATS
jgi:8-oxo-dGTP diphosphatase